MSQTGNYAPVNLSDSDLDALALDPTNKVFKYQQLTEKLDKRVPLDTVREDINDLFALYQRMLKFREGQQYGNVEYKRFEQNITRIPRWSRFRETHPHMFERCILPDTTRAEIDAMEYMIDLKIQNESGKADNAKEQLRDFVLKTFGKPDEEAPPVDHLRSNKSQ